MVSKTFIQRMCIGSAITLFSFFLIYFSHVSFLWMPFISIIGLVILFALNEYCNILKGIQIFPEKELLFTVSAAYILSVILSGAEVLPFFFLMVLLASSFFSLILKNRISVSTVAFTVLGFVWITIPMISTYQVNYFFPEGSSERGENWLLYILFVTKMCDTVAYFVGSKFGKNKLCPSISPNKTVEGAIGGILGAVVTSYIFHSFSWVSISLPASLILGLVMAFLSGLGDLAESIFKRDARIKDSNQIPGLGGVFDIVDSLLFTAPCIYFYLIWNFPR